MLGDSGLHAGEECELPSARAADEADAMRVDAESARVGAHVTHARGDVGARRRMAVVRPLAEVHADDDEARGGERPAVDGAARPVEAIPGAAVNVDQRARGPAASPFGR